MIIVRFMRIIVVRNAGNGSGYIDVKLFGRRLPWVESIKYGNEGLISQEYRKYLSNWTNVVHQLRNPDKRFYNLIKQGSASESTPNVDNCVIGVNRLVFAPLDKPCIIIYPIEKLETMIGRAIYKFATKGGIIPPIDRFYELERRDQDLLASLFDNHRIIFYDNVQNKLINDMSNYTHTILSNKLLLVLNKSI